MSLVINRKHGERVFIFDEDGKTWSCEPASGFFGATSAIMYFK